MHSKARNIHTVPEMYLKNFPKYPRNKRLATVLFPIATSTAEWVKK